MRTNKQLRDDIKALRHVGNLLANCAFNLARNERLPQQTRETLDECRRAWDETVLRVMGIPGSANAERDTPSGKDGS